VWQISSSGEAFPETHGLLGKISKKYFGDVSVPFDRPKKLFENDPNVRANFRQSMPRMVLWRTARLGAPNGRGMGGVIPA